MSIKGLQSQWILIACFMMALNCVFFSVDYRWFGILFVMVLGYRIIKSKESLLMIITTIVVLLFIPIFYHTMIEINRPYEEHERAVQFIPHWTTYQKNSVGYTVEGKCGKQCIKAFLTKEQCPPYHPVKISGYAKVHNGSHRRNSGGYDERVAMKMKGISSVVSFQKVNLSTIKMPFLWNIELKIKQQANKFPKYTRQYIQMLLFGMVISDNTTIETYRHLGIAHLFSLSGFHVYIIAFLFNILFLRLNMTRKCSFWLVVIILVIFYFFTGHSVGVFRSSVMYLLKGLKTEYQYPTTVLDRWSIALLIHLMVHPLLLMTQGGVLTYMMSLCVIILGQKCDRHPFLFSVSFFIITLPLIAHFFYQANPISIFLNELCMPLFSYCVIPLLIIMFLLSYIGIPSLLIVSVEYFLKGITQGLSIFQCVPSIELIPFSPVSFLIFIMVLIFLLKKQTLQYRHMIKFLGIIVLLFTMSQFHFFGSFTMIDIGQGDSLFIQPSFSFNQQILIDCGGKVFSRSKSKNATYTLVPCLKSKRVRTLDSFFITHADSDHMGDMLEVIKNFKVKHLYYSAGCEQKMNFRKKLNQAKKIQPNMTIQGIKAPSTFNWHHIQLKCLWPKSYGEGKNNDSLVFMLQCPKRKFLLTGDLEKEGEYSILQSLSIIDILKVGHHGSKTATSDELLLKTHPKVALISCGKHNRFHHPHLEVLQRLKKNHIKIIRTDEVGMIEYRFLNHFEYWYFMNSVSPSFDSS